MPSFLFNPLCENDIDLLYRWFQEPVINQWYAKGRHWSFEDIKQKYSPRIWGVDTIPSYIISQKKHPVGFIQYYCLAEYLPEGIQDFNHPLFKVHPPSVLIGLDLFVADQNNRGRGLGKQILDCFMLKLPKSTAAVVVDPESGNEQAIRCFIQAGFQLTNYSNDKVHLILLKKNE